MAAKAFTYPQDVLWTMRDKRQIRLGDMTDSHIANTIRMLKRQQDRHMENCAAGYSYCSWFGNNPDSMGAYYAEIEADHEGDKAGELANKIHVFMDELRRRHPHVNIRILSDEERRPRLRL